MKLREGMRLRGFAVGSGGLQARDLLVLATLLYRASHLAFGFSTVVQHQRDRPVSWVVLATAVACSVLLYGDARRKGGFSPWFVAVDLLVTACALPFVAYAWAGTQQAAEISWVMVLGGSASAVAAVTFGRWTAVGAVLLIAVTHVIGYRMVDADLAVIGGHTNSVLSSAVVACVLWWYVNRQRRLLDAATGRALKAEAQRARYAERIAHHRALHDTVLATLTTIAGGSVDANTPQVRNRCAREAAYLRRLIQQTDGQEGDGQERGGEEGGLAVGVALEEAVRAAEELQLRVTAQYHELPTVPSDVAEALGDAVGEAFRNVLRHSGTKRAYLTATGDEGRLVVTVIDRGVGFDLARLDSGGLGLRRSVHARMREIGGSADVDSAPGEGARVELRWPG